MLGDMTLNLRLGGLRGMVDWSGAVSLGCEPSYIVKDIVKLFPSIYPSCHPSHHPSMDGII
jgi:hypothetical protein